MTRLPCNLSLLLMASLLTPCVSVAANTAAAARAERPAAAPDSFPSYSSDYEYYLKKLPDNGQKKGVIASEVQKFRSYPHLERAYRFMKQHRYAEAKKDLAAYLELAPGDARARLSYLELLATMSLPDQVVFQADQVIARWPSLVPAYMFRGLALQRMKKSDQAHAVFLAIAAMNYIRAEDRIFALTTAADIDIARERYGDAINNLNSLNALEKKHASFMKAGYLNEKLNKLAEALVAYGEAGKLARSAAEKSAAASALAQLHWRMKEWDAARRAFEELRAIDPGNRDALRGLARIANLRKQYAESEKWIRQIPPGELKREDHELLANLYLQKQDHDAAIKELRTVASLQGTDATAETLSVLAQSYEAAGRLKESESVYRSLLAKGSGNSELYFRYGTLLVRMEQFRAGASAFQKAIALGLADQRKGEAHRSLARIYERLGQNDLATAELENSLNHRLPNQDEDRISLARLLSRSGKDAEALRQLDGVVNSATAAARLKRTAYLEKSLIFEGRGRFSEAASQLEKAGADSAEALLRLATLLEASGRTDDALKWLDQALAKQNLPKEQQLAAYRQRGVILEKTGHPAEAARSFERAMALGDGSPSMYLGLAQLYQAAGEQEKAGEYFQKVVDMPGVSTAETCAARDGLGMLALSGGRISESIPQLAGALSLCGETWQRHYYLGIAYYRDKQWQPAMDQLQRADAIKKDAATLLYIALCHKELGKRGTAIAYLQLALQETANAPLGLRKQILDTLGYAYADESAYERAAGAFAQSLELAPDNIVSLKHASVLSRTERTDEAWQALQKVDTNLVSPALKIEYNDLKADLLQKRGQGAEALQIMEENQKRAPSASRSYEMGLLCRKLGQLQKTNDYLRSAYEMEPGNMEYALSLGYAYASTENYPEATALFEKVAEQHPDYTKVYEELGYLYMKAGDNERAAMRFKQALDRYPAADFTVSGENERWGRDAERIRGEIGKLTKNVSGVAYWSYRSGTARNTVLIPGGQASGGLTGQVGLEVSARPPVIGFRDDRMFEVFGRVFGNQKNDSAIYQESSTQAGIGVRAKPLQSENIWISAEKLLKIGDDAVDDWLFRLLYSRGSGSTPLYGTSQQNYSLLYGEADYYVRSDTTAAHLEARTGGAFSVWSNALLIPHLVVDGSWQTPFTAGSTYLEGGAGLLLRYFFNGTRYENYRNTLDLSATYKHGLFFDKDFRKKTDEYDSGILSIGLGF